MNGSSNDGLFSIQFILNVRIVRLIQFVCLTSSGRRVNYSSQSLGREIMDNSSTIDKILSENSKFILNFEDGSLVSFRNVNEIMNGSSNDGLFSIQFILNVRIVRLIQFVCLTSSGRRVNYSSQSLGREIMDNSSTIDKILSENSKFILNFEDGSLVSFRNVNEIMNGSSNDGLFSIQFILNVRIVRLTQSFLMLVFNFYINKNCSITSHIYTVYILYTVYVVYL